MKKPWIVAAVGVASLVAAALATGVPPANAAPAAAKLHPAHVCKAVVARGEATCHALKMVNDKGVTPAVSAPPPGALTPTQLRSAYNLAGTSANGRTVAIVDAYGYPNLERDLGVYRGYFGLDPCTKANGCLQIVNQSGGTSLPKINVGWAEEQALDVDAVSAACPSCKILVVQASSASIVNLGKAVNTAAALGAVAISNSYGGGDLSDTTYGTYYNHPGIAITASTGDNGYQGGSFPASSTYVTAVGGTSLTMSGSSRVAETVWDGAGSGCSTVNVALGAAAGFNTGCTKRAIADVAAAADPNTGGLAVYAPTNSRSSGWAQYGGTSESSPIIASVYALAGGGYSNATPYSHTSSLFDVTTGSNGSCPTTQWCTARTGWDGPTGLGTPNGTGAF